MTLDFRFMEALVIIYIVLEEMMILEFLVILLIHLTLKLEIPTILHGMMVNHHGKTLNLL